MNKMLKKSPENEARVSSRIQFGTDGWRARIAEDFTFAAVRRAAAGLARVLPRRSRVAVGWDSRFGSERFALAAAGVLAAAGHRPAVSDRLLPTPAVTLAVAEGGFDAGIAITASHNSWEYNGFKVKLPPGVSAPPEFTRCLERAIPARDPGLPSLRGIARADFLSPYLRTLRRRMDVAAVRRAGFRVAFDSMGGVGMRHFEALVGRGRTQVVTVGGEPHPLFGGRSPEPVEENLRPLERVVRALPPGRKVGLAVDGDGDRVALADERGRTVSVHLVHALLLRHLVERRRLFGAVVRTVSGTLLLDRMAAAYGLPVEVTPVGFKHIAKVMNRRDVLIGAEESGGIAVKGHLPERDGLFLALLLLEALAEERSPVSRVVEELRRRFGPFYSGRRDLSAPDAAARERALERLRQNPPSRAGGLPVREVGTLDGLRLALPDAWLLFRCSGTEPLWRVYAESPSRRRTEALLSDGCRMLLAAAGRAR